MAKALLIGVLHGGKEYSGIHRLLVSAPPHVQAFCFCPSDISWEDQWIRGLCCTDEDALQEITVPFPQAIYNNRYLRTDSTVKRFEEVIGKGRVFNRITKLDKWTVYEILKSSEWASYLPHTVKLKGNAIAEMLDGHRRLILKPRFGSNGRGVYAMETTARGRLQLYRAREIPVLVSTSQKRVRKRLRRITRGQRYIVQQWIPLAKTDGHVFDVRMMVQRDGTGAWDVSGIASRVALRDYYVTNICSRVLSLESVLDVPYAVQKRLQEEMTTVSIHVAETLDRHLGLLGEISVDFGLDSQQNVWIIEVNGHPRKSLFTGLDDPSALARVYSRPMEFATHLALQ